MNQNVSVEVRSSDLLQSFTYQLVAHGKVVYAENVAVPNSYEHIFKFKATFDLVPEATLIVYRFNNDDIVANKTEIAIDEDLNNFVKLKLSSLESQPGKDINIDIITNPDSFVGLVGVDQSVFLLKENEDLTRQAVTQEMNDYDKHFHDVGEGTWSVETREYTNDYWKNFKDSDVILFTNAKKDGKR